MTELKCEAENCTYNKDHLCSKGDILIGGRHAGKAGETCCESFLERRDGLDAFVSSISRPSSLISVDCEASRCVYNVNYKCHADKVDISGSRANERRETACSTFFVK